MPKKTGLELIASLSEKKLNVKYIIISGYKDFDYAHKAIQYGVKSYLLKPIDEYELNNTLKQVRYELTNENIQQEKVKIYENEIIASKQIIKKNLFRDIIRAKKYSPDNNEKNYNVVMGAPLFRVIDIKLDYSDFNNIDKKQDRITIEKITGIVEKIFDDNVCEDIIYADESLNIYCMLNYSVEKSAAIKDYINNVLIDIEKFLLGFEMYQVTIGIGQEISDFNEITRSLEEAVKAVNSRIKRGNRRLIYAENISFKNNMTIRQRLGSLEKEYINAVNTYSLPEFEKTIDDIFEKVAMEDRIDFSYYYDMASYIIKLFFKQIDDNNEDSFNTQKYLLDISQHCSSASNIKKLLKKHLSEYLATSYKQLELKSTKPVREAKDYIDNHFSEKITLESISEVVILNPIYFSVLFKKETGDNFSSYLVKIRTEKAKEMLKNSNHNISSIAESVGYKDVRYFSRLFTKNVGIKPAIYRKLYS